MSQRARGSTPFDLPSVPPWRRWGERILTLLAVMGLGVTLAPLVAVLAFVVRKGLNRFNGDLFTQLPPAVGLSGGGAGNAILGTLLLVSLATVLSVPIGVMAALFLSEYSPGSVARGIRLVVNVLSGVPSIIIGIFGYAVLVLTTKTFSAVAGGVALGILMLPLIIRTTEDALRGLPAGLRTASVGVGASRYQTAIRVILPAALPGILTGSLLAVARAAGETAPLLFTALSSLYWIRTVWEPTPSLAVLIYNFSASPFQSQQELAWAASLLVVILVLLTSVGARLLIQFKP